jgi:hypothetical protein
MLSMARKRNCFCSESLMYASMRSEYISARREEGRERDK